MLVLSRKPTERILIFENPGDTEPLIELAVVRIGPNSVRLGIEAPRALNIVREELVQELRPFEEPAEVQQA